MHVLAETVREKFAHLINFDEQMKFAEQASHSKFLMKFHKINEFYSVSLESLTSDVMELERGHVAAQRERDLKKNDCPPALVKFLDDCDDEVHKLKANHKLAQVGWLIDWLIIILFQEAFSTCVEFYGESAKTAAPTTFFTTLVNFVRNFKAADEENLQRIKQQQVCVVTFLSENSFVLFRFF